MTTSVDYDIVGGYDDQRVSSISAQRSVNLFEYFDPEGKRLKTLLPTSGLVNVPLNLFGETGGARAAFVFKNAIYQVYGRSMFQTTGTTGALVTIKIGEFPGSVTGYVGIEANTFQVIFVDGNTGWIYDTNTNPGAVVKITDTAFPTRPIDVCYIDEFFVVINGETNTFQMSKLNQGLIWGPDHTSGVGNAFVATSGGSPNLVLTTGAAGNYQVGTPIVFSVGAGGVLPVGTPPIVAGVTYYVTSIVSASPLTITISTTPGGPNITFSTTGTAIITVSNNGVLQLGSITSHPGTVTACRTLHRRVFFFCQNFTEVWENSGKGTNLPLRRNNALLMEVGTTAVGSVVSGLDRMFFLSQDKDGLSGVMEVKGTESVLVSNRALDFQLAQYAEDPLKGISDARGVLIKENGLIFYRLNFTRANHTFVLNVTMSSKESIKWHEEEVLNGDRHPAQTHAYFDGINYYGAYNGPIFYLVDDQASTNAGEPIRRMRIGRQMSPEGYTRLRIDRFQLDLVQGIVGPGPNVTTDLFTEDSQVLLTEDGEDIILDQEIDSGGAQPVVFLSISKDGGQTYGHELQGNMGKLGERTFRTVWRKLGTTPRGQGFIPRIQFYNEIPFVILGAAWCYEKLPE